MKKILIVCAILMAGLSVNVKAQDCSSCQSKLSLTAGRENLYIDLGNGHKKTGHIYMATMTSTTTNVNTSALCLTMGATARTGDIYRIDDSMPITDVMRKAYAFVTNHRGNEAAYVVAQIAVWMEQNGVDLNTTTLTSAARQGGGDLSLVSAFLNQSPYTGELHVYKCVNNANRQYFLAGVPMGLCPPTCTTVNPPSNCPSGGGVMKVEAAPAVCNSQNSTNVGYFTEELDNTECGFANEYGSPTHELGSYCYLYCKESIQQFYPGGISSPISLGTSIVWPTSAATEKTIWRNLYSLSYTGNKTCHVVVAPNTMQKKDPKTMYANALKTIQSYQVKYNTVKNPSYNKDNCQGTFKKQIEIALEELEDARFRQTNAVSAWKAASNDLEHASNALNSANQDYNRKLSSYNSCKASVDRCNKNESSCISSCYASGGSSVSSCISDCTLKYNCGECDEPSRADVDKAERDVADAQNRLSDANREKIKAELAVDAAEAKLSSARSNLSACQNYISAQDSAKKIINELNSCLDYDYSSEDIYQFDTDTSISYNDPEFGATYQLTGNTSYQCNGCNATPAPIDITKLGESAAAINTAYQTVIDAIDGKEITVNATATYSLPNNDSIYRYVQKKTNKPLKNPVGDYINVGYSFLPTSYNASVKQKYNLQVIVNSLGEGGKFTQFANDDIYTCNYSLTSTPTDECTCPVGTAHAGEDLYPYIYNASTTANPMTCADAQLKYCNAGTDNEIHTCPTDPSINITECLKNSSFYHCIDTLCPNGSGDKFCPNDESIKITACLNSGNSYNFCVNTICNSGNNPGNPGNPNNVDYHCPKGTWNDGMDIKPCVFANIGPNTTLDQALNYCVNTVCPYKGGINIIYRTISLRNPFPGKTAGSGVIDVTRKFSLDNLRGRYPGANWNSEQLVKTQILYNRDTVANAVYTKEPMYSFVLDTATINKIRKYNEKQKNSGGYSDNTLECNSSGVACLSNKFLRDYTSGLTSGTCKNASHGSFYTCAESLR